MFWHYLANLENYNCCRFQWHVRPQNLSSKIWGRFNTSGLNPVTIKSGKLWGSVMSANWSSGWLTCNMGCSRQSLMKLAPVNGVNVCDCKSSSSNHILNVLALSAFCASYIAQKLIKSPLWYFCSVCRRSTCCLTLLSCKLIKPSNFNSMIKSSAVILDFWISLGSVATQLRQGGRSCNS